MEGLAYATALSEIFSRRATRRNDLSIMQALLQYYGNPHLSIPTVHITGTNGKGLVAGKVARALQLGGYAVGLYLSPHLDRYAERISIDGQHIPQEAVIAYWADLKVLIDKLGVSPSFFDCTTILGFRYFAEQKVDIAVIEVGIGGRYDSTNVVQPLVSAITSVSDDHAAYLGASLEEIAQQKAGVIKPHTPVVIGPSAHVFSITQRAEQMGAPLVAIKPREGEFDVENRAVAGALLHLLAHRFPLDRQVVERGIEYMLPCRLERRGRVMYDIAHNPGAFSRLIEALRRRYPNQTFRFVVGMSRDKDIAGSLRYIGPICDQVHFVKACPHRGADPRQMAQQFAQVCSRPYVLETSIVQGVTRAKAALKQGQLLVICGSVFLMREARR